MNLFNVGGIDTSLKGCGVCLLNSQGGHRTRSYSTDSQGKLVSQRFERYELIAGQIVEDLREAEAIAIEGYVTQGKFVNYVMFEIGAVVRQAVKRLGVPIIEINPSTLKSAVACNGRAKKPEMLRSVFDRWGVTFDDHNESDAYCCARVALSVVKDDWQDSTMRSVCKNQIKQFRAHQATVQQEEKLLF